MPEADWTRLDSTIRDVLRAEGGITHVSALDEAGLTRRQVASAFRHGVVDRPRIGWYTDPALPWQVAQAVQVGGVACCVTAADLWGLPVPPLSHTRLHVLVDADKTRLRHSRDRSWVLRSVDDDRGVELHRRALHDPVAQGRTSPIDTLVQLAGCVPEPWWVAALDAALHVPREGHALLGPDDYARLLAMLPRRRRRSIRLVDPRSESCIETLLRLALLERGIPFTLQAVLHPSCRVDFLLPGRLVVEADGASFHDEEQDRARDALLRSLGYRILRFSYERIVADLDGVVADIEAALSAF